MQLILYTNICICSCPSITSLSWSGSTLLVSCHMCSSYHRCVGVTWRFWEQWGPVRCGGWHDTGGLWGGRGGGIGRGALDLRTALLSYARVRVRVSWTYSVRLELATSCFTLFPSNMHLLCSRGLLVKELPFIVHDIICIFTFHAPLMSFTIYSGNTF